MTSRFSFPNANFSLSAKNNQSIVRTEIRASALGKFNRRNKKLTTLNLPNPDLSIPGDAQKFVTIMAKSDRLDFGRVFQSNARTPCVLRLPEFYGLTPCGGCKVFAGR